MILNKKSSSTFKKRNLITYSNPDSIISDQFRTIRTNIQFLTEKKTNRIFLLTSTGKGDGKSTLTSNLAVSMAQQQEKVLLIDGNLREPTIHSIFKIPNEKGLTNVLRNQVSLEEAVYQTDISKLNVLTSGKFASNPVELLGNHVMKELLNSIANSYDMVLIDSPSVIDFTETRVLANQCDGIILVLNRGKTELKKTIEAKKIIELAHGNLVGAIINEM